MKKLYVTIMTVLFINGCIFCYFIFSSLTKDDKTIIAKQNNKSVCTQVKDPIKDPIISSNIDQDIKTDNILLQDFDFKNYITNLSDYVKAVEDYTNQLGDIQYNVSLNSFYIEIMFNGEVGALIKVYLESGINKDTHIVISNKLGYSVSKKLGDIMDSNNIIKVSNIRDLIELAPDLVQYVEEG